MHYNCYETEIMSKLVERGFKSLLPGQRIVNVGVMVQPTSPRIAVFIGLAHTKLLGCCSNGARVALKQAMG